MKYLCRDKDSLDKYFFIPEGDMEDYARKHDRLPVIYYKSGKTPGSLYATSLTESEEIWDKYTSSAELFTENFGRNVIEQIDIRPYSYDPVSCEQIEVIEDKINELIVHINKLGD